MDETEFWELVDATRDAAEGDPEEQADLLVDRLLALDPDMVLDFARHFFALGRDLVDLVDEDDRR